MVAPRPWGFWTESKLDMLSAYLPAFTTASKKAPATVYLDLFAGQADNVSRETSAPVAGSVRRALGTSPPFTVVRAFELQPGRALNLQKALLTEFPTRDLIVHSGDVHASLRPALEQLAAHRWSPTFAFVDPDGVEARWDLLETLAAHKAPTTTKVELFLLLASPQIVRIVNDQLDDDALSHAQHQVTAVFGSQEWQPILRDRRAGLLGADRTRDELTNLMRWRLETVLRYQHTHTLRLTNVQGVPLYDMIFATDHPAGDRIMKSVYAGAARRFPGMRREAQARRRDRQDRESGVEALFPMESLAAEATRETDVIYEHTSPSLPYGSSAAQD
ncbi:MAG: three-Cys-motif partner protein TcmP [Sporichthyaceae bacterium]